MTSRNLENMEVARSASDMENRSKARTCYVYLQLPNTGQMVACARYTREIVPTGQAVGSLIYGRTYRARNNAVPIDPYELPVIDRLATTAAHDGIFGALRDNAPDGWGQRVISRLTGRTDLDIVDYLLHSPDDHAGALTFGTQPTPPTQIPSYQTTLQLPELLAAAELVEQTDPSHAVDPSGIEVLPKMSEAERIARIHAALVAASSGIGGARPKHVVEDDGSLWIAKFPSIADRWNNASVEAAMLALAARAGITVPKTRIVTIGGRRVLLVERFDRASHVCIQPNDQPYLRYRMVSALTVLRAEASMTDRRRWSYLLLSDELQRWSHRPSEDRQELYRRMVFNALISNLDDHPRNHALIAPDEQFQLAPAYDLVPHPVHAESRDLALECGLGSRRASRENLLSASARFNFDRETANQLITHMKALIVAEWENEIRSHGGSVADCNAVHRAFVPLAFEFTS